MEAAVLILLIIALCAWLDDKDGQESGDPVALALPALQELEREARQAMDEIRALDQDGGGHDAP